MLLTIRYILEGLNFNKGAELDGISPLVENVFHLQWGGNFSKNMENF